MAEHYFLALLIHYSDADEFRRLIRTTTDPDRRARLTSQYNWLTENWFGGAEFKRGPSANASLTADGVLCLPGECSL